MTKSYYRHGGLVHWFYPHGYTGCGYMVPDPTPRKGAQLVTCLSCMVSLYRCIA